MTDVGSVEEIPIQCGDHGGDSLMGTYMGVGIHLRELTFLVAF